LQFEVTQSLDPRTAQRGDLVRLRLTRALLVEGAILLPVDFETDAIITRVHRENKCDGGRIDLALRSVRLPGSAVARTAVVQQGPGRFSIPKEYAGTMLPHGWGYRLGMIPIRVEQAAAMAPFVVFIVPMFVVWASRQPSGGPCRFMPFQTAKGSTVGVAVLKKVRVHP
jgi:hypothetical protein